MEKQFKGAHAVPDERRGRRNENRVSRASAAQPVLASPKLAGVLTASATARQKNAVNLSNETKRQGKVLGEPLQSMIERGDVVAYLLYVVERDARLFSQLEKEKVRKRGLSAFNLRRKNGFFSHVHGQKERSVGKERRDAVQTTERHVRLIEAVTELGGPIHRRIGRERGRNEGFHHLSADGDGLVASLRASRASSLRSWNKRFGYFRIRPKLK